MMVVAEQHMRMVLLGNPHSRRTALLQSAVAARFPALSVALVSWADLICRRADLRDLVRRGDIVRIDSPGKDFEVERMLLRAGAGRSRHSGSGIYFASGD